MNVDGKYSVTLVRRSHFGLIWVHILQSTHGIVCPSIAKGHSWAWPTDTFSSFCATSQLISLVLFSILCSMFWYDTEDQEDLNDKMDKLEAEHEAERERQKQEEEKQEENELKQEENDKQDVEEEEQGGGNYMK